MTNSHLLKFDSPIHNLQVFLRTISGKYSDIPDVIPDGVYGTATISAVEAFKKKFMSGGDGSVGFDTWSKIVDVYKKIESDNYIKAVFIYPESAANGNNTIDKSHIRIIQSMLLSLSDMFSNIPSCNITGVVDTATIEAVKAVQYASGLNPDGNITSTFWNYLSSIYEVYVSNDRLGNSIEINYITRV